MLQLKCSMLMYEREPLNGYNIPKKFELPQKREKSSSPVVEFGFAGELRIVLPAFKEKLELIEAGDSAHEKIKTACVLDNGAMRGVVLGGKLAAFAEKNLHLAVDIIAATSTGSACAAGLYGGDPQKIGEFYYEHLAKNNFIDISRAIGTHNLHNLIDMKQLETLLRNPNNIDPRKIKDSRTQIFVGTTNMDTAEQQFFHLNDKEDPIPYVMASLYHPLFSNTKVLTHEDVRHVDGVLGRPIPDFNVYDADYILIFLINPLVEEQLPSVLNPLVNIVQKVLLRNFSPQLRDSIKSMGKTRDENIAEILDKKNWRPNQHIAVIYPTSIQIDPYCMDSSLLRRGYETAKKVTSDIIDAYAK